MTKSKVYYFLVKVPDEAWQFPVLCVKQHIMEDQQTTQSHHMPASVHFTRFNYKETKGREGEIKKKGELEREDEREREKNWREDSNKKMEG